MSPRPARAGMHTAVHTTHISVGVRSPPLTLWCDFVQGDIESEEDFSEWALGLDGLPVSVLWVSLKDQRRHPYRNPHVDFLSAFININFGSTNLVDIFIDILAH